MTSTRLYLFGDPRIERNGKLVHIDRRKVIALLAYLAVNRQPYSRDAIATLFWPELDQTGARSNLRRVIFFLRKVLDEDALLIDRDHVGLDPAFELWSDAAEFQARLQQAGQHQSSVHPQSGSLCPECAALLADAIALYTHDFMAGFSLPDSSEFDDWQFFQAETYKQGFAKALQSLILWHRQRGEYEAAIELARRWLALDAFHEPAHRELMALFALAGQQSAALRQYQECVRLLDAELGVEPEEETVALYQAIRARKFPPPSISADAPAQPPLTAVRPASPPAAPAPGVEERPPPNNLPGVSTALVGRQKELAQLTEYLQQDDHHRLVTLLGPGGVGKTRLALEAASTVLPAFPDGVYFLSLAPLDSPEHIVELVAEALQFRFAEAYDRERQVLDFLTPKRLLLVLDNFEHLLPGTTFVQQLLAAAPRVKALVTSRERLNLSGEILFHLGGLHYPVMAAEAPGVGGLPADQAHLAGEEPSAAAAPAAEAQTFEAVQLLLESAAHLRPGIEFQPADLAAAARICRLVEGMPLAILLAASWLELLSFEEIVAEIEQNLDFLASESADLPDRQRSLRAVFDASWKRLSLQEQGSLQALSIFQGAFGKEAAQQVSGAGLSTLLTLMQKSWLQRDGTGRYHIHELLRQFALAKLQQEPETERITRDRYAHYYAALLKEQAQAIHGPQHQQAFATIAQEWENIRSAWTWLASECQFETLTSEMLPAMFHFAEVRLKPQDLLHLIDLALQIPQRTGQEIPACERARLLIARVSFFRNGDPIRFSRYDMVIPADKEVIREAWDLVQSFDDPGGLGAWEVQLAAVVNRVLDPELGRSALARLVQVFREQGQSWKLAFALQMLGWSHLVSAMWTGEKEPLVQEAGRYLPEALDLFRRLGDELESGFTLRWLGSYHFHSAHWEEAIRTWKTAQANLLAVGNWPIAADIEDQMGDLYLSLGEFETAFQYYRANFDRFLQAGHPRMAAYTASKESYLTLRHGEIRTARERREQALRLSRSVQDRFGEAWSLWEMGDLMRVAGEPGQAGVLYEQAHELFERTRDTNGRTFYHRGLGDLALARGDYATAAREHRTSLENARQVGFKWGATYAHSALVRAFVGLNGLDEAEEHLAGGLELALTTGDTSLALVVLLGEAQLLRAQGNDEAAAALLTFIREHVHTWNETRAQALVELQELTERLLPEQLAAAQERGRSLEVWALVRREMPIGS